MSTSSTCVVMLHWSCQRSLANSIRLLAPNNLRILQAVRQTARSRTIIRTYMTIRRVSLATMKSSLRSVPHSKTNWPSTRADSNSKAVKTNCAIIDEGEKRGVRVYLFSPCIVCKWRNLPFLVPVGSLLLLHADKNRWKGHRVRQQDLDSDSRHRISFPEPWSCIQHTERTPCRLGRHDETFRALLTNNLGMGCMLSGRYDSALLLPVASDS